MIPVYAAGRLQQQQYMQQQQQQQQQRSGDGRHANTNGANGSGGANGTADASNTNGASEGEGGKSARGKGGKAQEGAAAGEQGQVPAPLPQTQVPNLDALNYYVLGQVSLPTCVVKRKTLREEIMVRADRDRSSTTFRCRTSPWTFSSASRCVFYLPSL
jgi:hypothetical protein